MVPAGAGLTRWTAEKHTLAIELKLSFSSTLPGFMGVNVCLWIPNDVAMVDATTGVSKIGNSNEKPNGPTCLTSASSCQLWEWPNLVSQARFYMPRELGINW